MISLTGNQRSVAIVVDPDAGVLASVGRCLQKRGAQVVCARSLGEVAHVLDDPRIMTVVVSATVPGIFDAMVRVSRSQPEVRRVMVARASARSLRELEHSGVCHVAVAKPLDADELLNACFGPLGEPDRAPGPRVALG